MNQSVPESVENNGNSVPSDNPEVMNHRSSAIANSMENVSVNGLLVLPNDDDEEKGIGSPQQPNNLNGFKVESPGGSVNSTRKGFGLKKWRRIKRDTPVKEEAVSVDEGSKLLKRGLSNLVNPPSKHLDLSSVEARQSSEGSVGSVNMLPHSHTSVANGFSPDPRFMFNIGQAFEKSEKHSSNSVGGKKGSEERVISQKEKPCSSLDSDLRSSDFVFSSSPINGEKDERLMMMMMNHIGEYSEEGHVKKESQTHSRIENGEKEEDGDESKKSNQYWEDKDQIADSIRNLATIQEALRKEIQSFQELGNESTPLHSNIDELSSCREETNLTSSGSQTLILKQKVKHLEDKLGEARTILKAKESRIQELENSKTETELEGIFQKKIETEIEHLMLTRSLKSLQVLKNSKKIVHSLTEDPEPIRGNILGKTCKFSFYFLTQLILLVSILKFLVLQYSDAPSLVLPT